MPIRVGAIRVGAIRVGAIRTTLSLHIFGTDVIIHVVASSAAADDFPAGFGLAGGDEKIRRGVFRFNERNLPVAVRRGQHLFDLINAIGSVHLARCFSQT